MQGRGASTQLTFHGGAERGRGTDEAAEMSICMGADYSVNGEIKPATGGFLSAKVH